MSTVVEDAIKAGKVSKERAAYWEKEMLRDPEGTKRLIASLEPGLPPGGKLPRSLKRVHRDKIKSQAGRPVRPHPMGGYYRDEEEARS
jgi:hypothetical protein